MIFHLKYTDSCFVLKLQCHLSFSSMSLQCQLQYHFKQASIYFELLFCDLVIDHLSLVKMEDLITKDTDVLAAVAGDND